MTRPRPRCPDEITTGQMTWTITLDADRIRDIAESGEYDELYGSTLKSRLELLIDPGVPEPVLVDTVVHEGIHALLMAYGIGFPSDEAEEHFVRQFTPALIALIRDNPELVRWVQHPTG